MAIPRVSVVMPVYNGEMYLRAAIESILSQTFRDFELLLIDDGSTDGTAAILARYRRDSRLRAISRENRGLIASLNEGWQRARGEYVARMDADDISRPDRLARQVAFLNTHPGIGVLGGAVEVIDEQGGSHGPLTLPATHAAIVWRLCFEDPIVHPTTMIRRAVLEQIGGYDPAMRHAEDYDLWRRACTVTRLHNLPQVVLALRRHLTNVSRVHRTAQGDTSTGIARLMIAGLLGEEVPLELVARLEHQAYASVDDARRVARLLGRLFAVCESDPSLTRAEQQFLARDAAQRLLRVAIRYPADGEIRGRLARFGLRYPRSLAQAVLDGWAIRLRQAHALPAQ